MDSLEFVILCGSGNVLREDQLTEEELRSENINYQVMKMTTETRVLVGDGKNGNRKREEWGVGGDNSSMSIARESVFINLRNHQAHDAHLAHMRPQKGYGSS